MTNALRMMPKDPEMWIMAGKRSSRNGDMAAARGFFMRGCRFCTKDCTLWLEYARSEMEWLEKIEAKKNRLGKNAPAPLPANDDDELRLDSDEEDEDNDGLVLPEPTKAEARVIDKSAAKQLESNPAMDGAIPMAIFDISQKQAFFKPEVGEQFFDMFASFKDVSVQSRISQHVLDTLNQNYPNHPSTYNCHIRQPIVGVSPFTAEFPRNLMQVLSRLRSSLEATTDKEGLEKKTAAWIDDYLSLEGLDVAIEKVLKHIRTTLSTVSPLE